MPIYDYDLQSAFPSVAKDLIDIRDCEWEQDKAYIMGAVYGFVKCEVTIYDWVKVSPIIKETDEALISPTGTWETCLTKDELDFIMKWGIGEFKILDGWWAVTTRKAFRKPLLAPMEKLLKYKQGTELQRLLAKRMCFSGDTQVMTPIGPRPIEILRIGELVYSVNPQTLETEIKPIVGIYKYRYDGDMLHFENKRHDLLVTPEHQMLLRRDAGKDYRFWEAGELEKQTISRWYFPILSLVRNARQETISIWDWADPQALVRVMPNKKWASTFEKDKRFRYIGNSSGYHTTRDVISDPVQFEQDKDCRLYLKNARRGNDLPWRFDMNDWLELIGWYLSEGNLMHDWRGIGITNTKPEPIYELLGRMKIPHGRGTRERKAKTIKILHHAIYNYAEACCGEYAGGKRIPPEIFELDHSHLAYLFKTLMAGDGSLGEYKKMAKYTTKSLNLAWSFQRLCLHLGYKTRVEWEDGKHPVYRVFIYSNAGHSGIKREDIKRQEYHGEVWGITVADNHTVLAGRNNKFEFVGQSTGIYGKMGEERAEEFGPRANFVWFATISTRTRLEVADFLYSHDIGPGDNEGYKTLLTIDVDGFKVSKPIVATTGQWKLAYEGPVLIVSSGLVYTNLTKPKGLKLPEVLAMIKEHPHRNYYERTLRRRLTLGDALAQDRLEDISKEMDFSVSLSLLGANHDRHFSRLPQSGQQLLSKKYRSEPIKV